MDILIKRPWVVTQDASRRIIKKDVFVSGNTIDEIGDSIGVRAEYRIDAEGMILAPGLINTHTHVAMGSMRGIADDVPLGKFLEKTFAIDAKRTEQDIHSSSIMGMREMVRTGTTSFLDLYYSEDIIAKAAKRMGLRAFLSWVVLDKDKTTQKGNPKDNAENFIKRFRSRKPALINAGVGLQGIYVCNDDTISAAADIAERYNTVIPMHVSETNVEVDNVKKEHGHGVVEHLDKLGVLNKRFVAVHTVHVSEKEVKLLAETAAVSHNPISNMKLGNGAAPIHEMSKSRVNVTLGTDSVASNNNLDMFSTMKFASLLQKNRLGDASELSAQRVLDFATINAAKALGYGNRLGSVEEGKLADLILIDPYPNAIPLSRSSIVSNMVYAVSGLNVDTTIVDGVPLMLGKEQSKM